MLPSTSNDRFSYFIGNSPELPIIFDASNHQEIEPKQISSKSSTQAVKWLSSTQLLPTHGEKTSPVPRYSCILLKEMVSELGIEDIRTAASIVFGERALYSISEYIQCINIISDRIISISRQLTNQRS